MARKRNIKILTNELGVLTNELGVLTNELGVKGEIRN